MILGCKKEKYEYKACENTSNKHSTLQEQEDNETKKDKTFCTTCIDSRPVQKKIKIRIKSAMQIKYQ